MKDLIITLEATCDLDKEMLKQYNLQVIDMSFLINGQEFSTATDDVVSSKLYESMKSGAKTSTSQLNVETYTEFFTKLLKEDKPILHLAFSSGLSSTCSSAFKSAEELNKKYGKKIYVIDSLCACSGQGMLGVLTREFAGKAETIEEVIEYVEKLKHNLNHCFTVDNLKYLASGGRIKQTSAIIGTILNIKPVMRMDEGGHLSAVKKVISRKKALLTIADTVKNNYDKRYDICYISHANCLHDADFLKQEIFKNTTLKPKITNLGSVIGCHSGPGTIAVYFISKNGR